MRSIRLLAPIMTLVLFSCNAPPQQAMTQLQLRQIQTRTLPTGDTKLAMKALLNVFQDEGYVVKNVDGDLGLLVASKEVSVEQAGTKFWSKFFWGANALWEQHALIEASATLTGAGDEHRFRVNFQKKVLNNHGLVAGVEHIVDEEFYQDFFSKVQKALFIEREML